MQLTVSTYRFFGLCLLICGSWHTAGLAADRELLAAARHREERVKEVAQRALPATVALGTFGSGVVVSEDGYILTAAHNYLVDQDVPTVKVTFADGRTALAGRLGANFDNDAGLLKIVGGGKWPHIPLASVKAARPGDWCVALGYPGGYGSWRSKPSVRIGRVLRVDGDVLVTDCACASGDSGGPLLNLGGQIIGLHSSIGHCVAINSHIGVQVFADQWERLLAGDRWGTLGGPTERAGWDEKATRGREPHELEKQHPRVLRELQPLASASRRCIVSVEIGDRVVSLGTAVDDRGGIVTKASELNAAEIVTCVLSDGSRYSAAVCGIDEEHDLALLVAKGLETTPVTWATSEAAPGSTVLTATPSGQVTCMGCLSHGPLSMKEAYKQGVPQWFRPQMTRLGAVPSGRLTGFPVVIQHDSPLYPEQCGGPLLNLDGEAIGVNIARFGRVESFALPADEVEGVIAKLKAHCTQKRSKSKYGGGVAKPTVPLERSR